MYLIENRIIPEDSPTCSVDIVLRIETILTVC